MLVLGSAVPAAAQGRAADAVLTCTPATSTFLTAVTCTVQLTWASGQVLPDGQPLTGPVTGLTSLMAFYINSDVFYANLDATTGRASITTPSTLTTGPLRVGTYNAFVLFSQPNQFVYLTDNRQNQVSLTVNPVVTTVTVSTSKSNPSLGEMVDIKATITSPVQWAGGSVAFYLGSTSGTYLGTVNTVSNNTATLFQYTNLPGGTSSIVAVYSGGSGIASGVAGATSSPYSITVSRIPSTATFNGVNPSDVGDMMPYTVSITQLSGVTQSVPPSGTYRVKQGGAVLASGTLVNGSATGTIGPLSLRQYGKTTDDFVRFDVEYDGDDRFDASTGWRAVFIKSKATGNPALAASSTTVPAGSPYTLTATVPGAGGLSPTGTVTFRDAGTGAVYGTQTLAGGVASVTVNAPASQGSLLVGAKYDGSVDFAASSESYLTLTIGAPQARIALTTSNATPTFGASVTLTATVTGTNPTGNVTFKDGSTTLGTVALSGGTASLTTSSLTGGAHSLTAVYAGDAANSGNTSSAVSVTVAPATTHTTIQSSTASAAFGTNVTLTATVTGASPGGTVTFKNGATTLGTGTISGGTASFATTTLPVGTNTITAAYAGDTNNAASTSGAASVSITKANSTIAVQASNATPTVGTNVTFTATVAPTAATGTVTFSNGATVLGTATLANGVATYSTSALAVGSAQQVSASYAGDANTNGSTSSAVSVTVKQIVTTTALQVSNTAPTPGQSITFTATISPPPASGTVQFSNGAQALGSGNVTNGTATFTTSSLAAGTYSVSAQYFGDTNTAPSQSAAVAVSVAKRTPTVGLSASTTSPAHAAPVTFTITMTSAVGGVAPTGQITLANTTAGTNSTATISGGTATVTLSNLGPGPQSFVAQYAGDGANNAANSATLAVTVGAAPSTTSLGVSSATSPFGTSVTLTATVAGTSPSGTVTFKDGATTLGTGTVSNGVATLATSALAVGTRTITAAYGGDSRNQTSTSAAVTVTIQPATGAVALQVSNLAPAFGTSIALTATVTGVNPTGNVTFKDGTTTLGTVALSGGAASLSTAALAIGTHSITASYSGDGNNASATSAAQSVVVSKSNNPLTLSVAPTSPALGQAVTLTAQYGNAAATGTVTFKNGTTTLGSATLSGGTASFSTTALPIGTHSITAEYAGDASNASAVSPAQSLTVGKTTKTLTLAVSPATQELGKPLTFTVQFGSTTAVGTVTYKAGTTTLGTSQLANGASTFSFAGLTAGSHSITAEYGGDTTHLPATSAAVAATVTAPTVGVTLQASAGNIKYGDSVTLTAAVAGLNPTGTVTFINANYGTPYGSATVNGGLATFTASGMAPGGHYITATYSGDSNNASRSSTQILVVVERAPSKIVLTSNAPSAAIGAEVTLTATLEGYSPLGDVTFTSSNGGVLGKRSAVSPNLSTTVQLKLTTLALGQHTITASYSGGQSDGPSTSAPITIEIVNTSGTFTLAASNASPAIGEKVTFTATLTTTGVSPTGNVTFLDGSKTLGTAPMLTGGKATFTTDTLELGTHAISAVYSGDSRFVSLTSPVLSVTVKPPTPTVSETPINVNYGSGGTIDLSSAVSADTTCIDVVVPPRNGTVKVSCNNPGAAAAMRAAGSGQPRRTAPSGSITIQYVPNPGFTGQDRFSIVAISPGGRSNPASVSLVIAPRANPATNAEVQGLVNAQVSTVRRLGQSQIANVAGRLEQLHDEDLPPVSMGLAFTAPEARDDMRTFREQHDPNYRSQRQFSDMQKLNRDLDKSMGQLGNNRAPRKVGPTDWAVWTSGTISLGRLNNQGGLSSQFTSEGVTAGVDYRIRDGFRVGIAFGLGADRTSIGSMGTRSSGSNISVTGYASYRLMPQTFLDVLAGYGHVRLSSRRFDTVNSVFLTGDRTGREFHGAVALTYEARFGKLKFAPYGRFEVMHVNLDAFTEDGLAIAALGFGSLTSTSYSGVFGLRTSYPFDMSWGVLTAMGRMEYRQTSEGGYTQALGYADAGGPGAFSIINRATGTGQLTLGIGAKAAFDKGGALDIEHQFSTSTTAKKTYSNTTRGRYQLNF